MVVTTDAEDVPGRNRSGQHAHSGGLRLPPFAAIAVCTYIASFAIPLPWNVPLVLLALSSLVVIVGRPRPDRLGRVPLVGPVLAFVAITGLSIAGSEDVARSVRLSTPLLPAVLVFFLIAEHFEGANQIRWLQNTFVGVTLWLSVAVLWHAWQTGWASAHTDASRVWSSILVEANDIAFLAVLAPFSFVRWYQSPRALAGILAALSLALAVCAAVALQSRTAVLAMAASIGCAAALMRPSQRAAVGGLSAFSIIVFGLLLDGVLGFPMVGKFAGNWTTSERLPLWAAAWAMFRDAPLLGQGPHTFVQLYESYVHDLGLSEPLRRVPWPHNLYLEMLAGFGIAGFLALMVLIVRAMSTTWRVRATAAPGIRAMSAATLAALVGFCLAAAVELTFLRRWVVVTLFSLFGLAACLSILSRQEVHGEVYERGIVEGGRS